MHQNLENKSNKKTDTGRPPEKYNDTNVTQLSLSLLSLFPVETPCLSPACQWASTRLSASADPFTQPCDYFLFTCGPDRLSPDSGGRQRGQGIPGHPQNQKEKAVWPERRGQSKEIEDREVREEKILDRKTVLLLYLREILGRSLQCVPLCIVFLYSIIFLYKRVYYMNVLSELRFS